MTEKSQGIALKKPKRSRKYMLLVSPQKPVEDSAGYQHRHSSPDNVPISYQGLDTKGKKRETLAKLPSGACVGELVSTNNPFRRPELHRELLAYEVNQENVTETWWQEYDTPIELQLVQAGTPQELCLLFKESLNYARAIQASLMEKRVEHSAQLFNNSLSTGSGSLVPSVLSKLPSTSTSDRTTSFDSTCQVNALYSTYSPTTKEQSDTVGATSGSTSAGCSLEPDFTSKGGTSITKESKFMQSKHPFLNLFRRKNRESKPPIPLALQPVTLQPAAPQPVSAQPFSSAKSDVYRECASCFDDVSQHLAITLSCQHYYCSSCFSKLVSTAILSEHTFPPKCCLQQVPDKTLKLNLPSHELLQYKAKEQEYSVPAGQRWFCASSSCGKWFEHGAESGTVVCPHCTAHMCVECRGPQHDATDGCTLDRALDATLALAEQNGWRRCYQCQALVELAQGCRRINCRCGAIFCYTCGARYGTCRCLESDEAVRQIELRARRRAREAEDAEVRAAIAAVEEGERQENERQAQEEQLLREASMQSERHRIQVMEARMAEEIQFIESIEAARLRNISQHYGSLHQTMARLHDLQRMAIHKRHTQVKEDLVQEYCKLQSRTRNVDKRLLIELANVRKDLARFSKGIHEEDARETADFRWSNRGATKVQLKMLNKRLEHDSRKSLRLEELGGDDIRILPIELDQDLRELNVQEVRPYLSENTVRTQQSVKQNMEEFQIKRHEREKTLRAEVLWLHAVVEERRSMLNKDQQRLERSGGEVRSGDVHTFITDRFAEIGVREKLL